MTDPEANEAGIEASLSRIETLVQEMESGDLPLETMIVKFEEGAKLVKGCQKKLDAAEKRIKMIVQETSGEISLEEFGEAG